MALPRYRSSGMKTVIMESLLVAIMGVGPTSGQWFVGAKNQIRFLELLWILQLLTGMITSNDHLVEGIEEIEHPENLHELAAGLMFQKHFLYPLLVTSFSLLHIVGPQWGEVPAQRPFY